MLALSANGKARKMAFARYPGLPLAEARKVAIGLYGQICAGRDPGQERKASRRREVAEKAPVKDRVEKIAKTYLAHAKTRTFLRVDVLPIWKGRRLSEISKSDVRQLLDGIVNRGSPIAVNRGAWAASRPCSLSQSSKTF